MCLLNVAVSSVVIETPTSQGIRKSQDALADVAWSHRVTKDATLKHLMLTSPRQNSFIIVTSPWLKAPTQKLGKDIIIL